MPPVGYPPCLSRWANIYIVVKDVIGLQKNTMILSLYLDFWVSINIYTLYGAYVREKNIIPVYD